MEYTVKYQRLAGYLMQRGFRLWGMRPNPILTQYNLFVFRDSPEIRDAIRAYNAEHYPEGSVQE